MIGTRLAHYDISSHLGSGGMGDVYQATDTKLGRAVALKLLPEAFSHNTERVARFEREARALAALNHPHIAAIYGFEESGGRRFLVMELAEGETLADRIRKGPLPIDEALAVARQIAEALEAAHEKGIIHRDLKPANIKVTPQGQVKVLDFGLAKAFAGDAQNTNSSDSPTISMAATQQGVILGTAAYMSPEQARGREVDRRTDLFAFGCVLYEMLTGRAAFEGEDVTDILSRVMQRDPDWTRLPAGTPAAIQRLLGRCLQKDRNRRLQAAGDARIEIDEAHAEPERQEAALHARSGGWPKLAWTASAILLVATAALAFIHFREAPPAESPEMRLEIPTLFTNDLNSIAISPDGQKVAFEGSGDSGRQLWIRPLNSETAQPLAGTEGATRPFWSPDSRSVAFFAQGSLKRTDLAGGSPQTLANATGGFGGTWGDGDILFVAGNFTPLMRVPASGGAATVVTEPAKRGEYSINFPKFLPDNRHFLFSISGPENSGVYAASLDAPEPQLLLRGAVSSRIEYLRSGWLLYIREGVLFAHPFDLAARELRGDPVALASRVASFSVSDNGTVAYRNARAGLRAQLTWFDRTGKAQGVMGDPDQRVAIANPELSPDGRRVAGDVILDNNRDVWLQDSIRVTRFTFDAGGDWMPIWSPDGARIAFRSNRSGVFKLYEKPSSGSGTETLLLDASQDAMPDSWSPNGRFLLYQSFDPADGRDIWALPLEGERKPFVFLKTRYNEAYSQFSPDGRWVAYQSDESGRSEVYIRPFPGPGGQWQVSTGGGAMARWRHDGKELYYVAPDQNLMAAAVELKETAVEIGAPSPLFPVQLLGGSQSNFHQQYDVARDGRFLINGTEDTETAPIVLLLNWHPPEN